MKFLFWLSVTIVTYTYVGYVLYLWIQSRLWPRPVHKPAIEPTVSVIMAVHNEEARLPEKLRNLGSLDYPKGSLELVIASDASTDRTDEIVAAAQQFSRIQTKSVRCPVRSGKAAALANAIAAAHGEILFFTDARQTIEPGALRELVANFADPSVGCASGELMLLPSEGGTSEGGTSEGVSAYWGFEKIVRKLEASVGSTVGATGAIYAARRTCVVLPPPGTLLDDVYIPITIARQGLRVVFDPAARAWDSVAGQEQEFRRKVRTLVGNYQLLQLAPWLLSQANPIRWAFFSHKLLRLLVPFLLLAAILTNLALLSQPFYLMLLALQACFYTAALLGHLLPRGLAPKPCTAASAFVLLNTAAMIAPFEYLRHRKDLTRLWQSPDAHSLVNSVAGGLTGELPVKN